MFVRLAGLLVVASAIVLVLFNVARHSEAWANSKNQDATKRVTEIPAEPAARCCANGSNCCQTEVVPPKENAGDNEHDEDASNGDRAGKGITDVTDQTNHVVLRSVLDERLSLLLLDESTLESGAPAFGKNISHQKSTNTLLTVDKLQNTADVAPVKHEEQKHFVFDTPMSHPAMYVHRFCLLQYRRMMRFGSTPHPSELAGTWRGINKGVATMAIDRQFIKQFYYCNGQLYGDNIFVHQVSDSQLACCGWQPIVNPHTGDVKRTGRFRVECPQGRGPFRHGLVLNYAAGGNRDQSRMIWDQVVKLDDNHMLGRATIRVGRLKVPVAFFVLERIPEPVVAPAAEETPVLQVSK